MVGIYVDHLGLTHTWKVILIVTIPNCLIMSNDPNLFRAASFKLINDDGVSKIKCFQFVNLFLFFKKI